MNENISDEINLMDYFQVLRKRKWLIILGTLLCMVVAGVVSLTMPKVYEAKTYLMVTLPKYQVEFATKEGSKISTPLKLSLMNTLQRLYWTSLPWIILLINIRSMAYWVR
ncbi:MAG: Wzz/FepE/Etk N-terminal domain-containing protein [Thermodesulfobacteriota bacterium]